ncbi:MAG: HAMP domain-containing sensor histidine kinase [Sphaerochaetaceae bacterium]
MNKKRGQKKSDKKEEILVILGLFFLLILLSALLLFLSRLIIDRENTLMQFEAERGFSSSTLLLLQQEHSRALATMEEDKVKGIGVYTSSGRLRLGLGSVPNTLPLDRFYEMYLSESSKLQSQGVAIYNKATQMIEYVRFSRLSIQVETGSFMLDEDGFLPSPLTFPDVLYILFDGQAYYRKIMVVRIFSAIAFLALVAIHYLVFRIYKRNQLYRETLAKQESLVNLGEAARTLAHEIKNPLSALTLQVALLKKTLPANAKEDLAVVDQEIGRLNQLTNKVSDFLRNPIGTPEKIDLIALLESLKQTFQDKIKLVKIPNQKVYIYFDHDRARSVFENLIKNALESCADRNPQVEVEIRRSRRNTIHIYIRDRGDGISDENMDKIFNPFFTTKIYGSGIGLSICRQFVRARGGDLKLMKREGGGTVALVILPSDSV